MDRKTLLDVVYLGKKRCKWMRVRKIMERGGSSIGGMQIKFGYEALYEITSLPNVLNKISE